MNIKLGKPFANPVVKEWYSGGFADFLLLCLKFF